MRILIPALVLLLIAPLAAAQPQDGDVVLTFAHDYNSLFDQGRVMYFNPANPTVLATLAVNSLPSYFHNGVRMAPGNLDLVVCEQREDFLASQLVQITPTGVRSTIVQLAHDLEGFELDGDDTWIAAGSTALFGVDHTTGQVTSFFTAPTTLFLSDLAIVRENIYPYAVGNFTVSSLLAPKVLGASRAGLLGTLVATTGNPLAQLSSLETDPRRGDLITTDFDGPPWEPNGTEVSRVTLNGQVSSLHALWGANAARIDQSDTAWVVGFIGSVSSLENAVVRLDLATRTVLTIHQFPQVPASQWSISGIEIYGSRVLTCNGVGGPQATIQVNVHSQHVAAPGASYVIACSTARRPNIVMPNGEWLLLDVTSPLFLLTAQNQVPTVFRRFVGTLDGAGGAQAEIRLPGGIPNNLGVTIFCAAVIYDATGVIQVSNTHWFEL